MLLDRRQPADGADHVGVGGETADRCRARTRAASSTAANGAQVESQRHDAVLIGAADAEVVAQLALDRRRDGDDAIADAGEQALEADEDAASSAG